MKNVVQKEDVVLGYCKLVKICMKDLRRVSMHVVLKCIYNNLCEFVCLPNKLYVMHYG